MFFKWICILQLFITCFLLPIRSNVSVLHIFYILLWERGLFYQLYVEISPHDSASVSCFNSVKFYLASLVAQTLKRLPTMQETQVQFLCQEDLLEKEMAPHSSTLAWKIPWTEDPGRLQSMGSQRVRHNWVTSLSLWCYVLFRYAEI